MKRKERKAQREGGEKAIVEMDEEEQGRRRRRRRKPEAGVSVPDQAVRRTADILRLRLGRFRPAHNLKRVNGNVLQEKNKNKKI